MLNITVTRLQLQPCGGARVCYSVQLQLLQVGRCRHPHTGKALSPESNSRKQGMLHACHLAGLRVLCRRSQSREPQTRRAAGLVACMQQHDARVIVQCMCRIRSRTAYNPVHMPPRTAFTTRHSSCCKCCQLLHLHTPQSSVLCGVAALVCKITLLQSSCTRSQMHSQPALYRYVHMLHSRQLQPSPAEPSKADAAWLPIHVAGTKCCRIRHAHARTMQIQRMSSLKPQ